MKTTERFERAVTKLYNAFHEGTLDAMDCTHCAVGNMCDNSYEWVGNSNFGNIERIRDFNNKTGYTKIELANIETLFIGGLMGSEWNGSYKRKFKNNISNDNVILKENTKEEQKELQFKGLCAVVEYLAELDNIPNPMDYSKLFEVENNKPKYELAF